MKIGLIYNDLNTGGSKAALYVSKYFLRRGHEPIIIPIYLKGDSFIFNEFRKNDMADLVYPVVRDKNLLDKNVFGYDYITYRTASYILSRKAPTVSRFLKKRGIEYIYSSSSFIPVFSMKNIRSYISDHMFIIFMIQHQFFFMVEGCCSGHWFRVMKKKSWGMLKRCILRHNFIGSTFPE